MNIFTVLSAVILAAQGDPDAAEACAQIDGAKLVTQDGTYLGVVGNAFQTDSIYNRFSSYGNRFNSNSIWNKFGTYGNQFSQDSPMSSASSTPPMMIKNRKLIGYLSKNRSIEGAVDPVLLGVVCFDFKPE